jgi:hypothetical protein
LLVSLSSLDAIYKKPNNVQLVSTLGNLVDLPILVPTQCHSVQTTPGLVSHNDMGQDLAKILLDHYAFWQKAADVSASTL